MRGKGAHSEDSSLQFERDHRLCLLVSSLTRNRSIVVSISALTRAWVRTIRSHRVVDCPWLWSLIIDDLKKTNILHYMKKREGRLACAMTECRCRQAARRSSFISAERQQPICQISRMSVVDCRRNSRVVRGFSNAQMRISKCECVTGRGCAKNAAKKKEQIFILRFLRVHEAEDALKNPSPNALIQ